jgi:chemotaxis protein MotB
MLVCARVCIAGLIGLVLLAGMGCQGRNPRLLQQSQLRARQLYEQNRALSMQRDGFGSSVQDLAAAKAQLEEQNQTLRNSLDVANQRLDNLLSSNQQLEQKFRNMMTSNKNPLSNDATRKLEELKRRYPEFDFDPVTGVSKFQTDLLFASGSDDVRQEALPILEEFARILNQPDAQNLKILVVGHTDDKPISKKTTREQHPTNWHLSTDRANSVVLTLKKLGLIEQRMGSAGYSMFQPVKPNSTDQNRQQNRRVEIFVLAPDAAVAGGWDPVPLN